MNRKYSGMLVLSALLVAVLVAPARAKSLIRDAEIERSLAELARPVITAAGLGTLLSMATAIAGGGEAALGIAAGTSATAQRIFLGHTRAEEASADQSGMRYLASAGIDPAAMIGVLDLFRGQELLSRAHQDPYVLSHPLSRDRLRNAKAYAAAFAAQGAPAPDSSYWFERTQGKLSAFLRNPGWTLGRLKSQDHSELALMQKAVALHRIPKPTEAIRAVDALIALRPEDPYYHELKGQILLESGHVRAAVPAYERAVDLAPNQPLILAGYGRALLALDTVDGTQKALGVLKKARARDPHAARMLRDLALAYARVGDTGMAALATAERYGLAGRLSDAAIHAKRAADLLPRGSSGWNRSQDVLRAAEAATKGKNRG